MSDLRDIRYPIFENCQAEAIFTTSVLGLGAHDISAVYSGEGSHAHSATSFTQTISGS